MKVLEVCAYAAPYEGNFMQSLFALEHRLSLKGIETIYAFPEKAAEIPWCQKLAYRAKVYFLPLYRAQFQMKTYRMLRDIYRENPDIGVVHSHFEQYDTPVELTAPGNVRVFWHLHDPIKRTRDLKGFLMKLKYRFIGRRAYLISVAEKYRRDMIALGFAEDRSETVLNGICLDRVRDNRPDGRKRQYDFLTFGWNFDQKGDDIAIKACDRIYGEGYRFRFLLNGLDVTWNAIDAFCHGVSPDYLVKGAPVNDINVPFSESALFVSASRRETFSYAIAEAAYAGLPVISSDIPGVEWAHDLPTVFFFESENDAALADLLRSFLNGRTLSDEDIDKTRRVIEEKYSVSSWVDRIEALYGV